MYRVVKAITGPLEGEEFVVEDIAGIGRSGDLAIQLIAGSVSRNHAELRVQADGTTLLVDLDSKNGTFLNGEAISEVVLRSGDCFEIGSSSFVFEEREGSAPVAPGEHLNLLSGPAEDMTQLIQHPGFLRPPARPTGAPAPEYGSSEGCTSPLHGIARAQGWKFCPVCGEPPE